MVMARSEELTAATLMIIGLRDSSMRMQSTSSTTAKLSWAGSTCATAGTTKTTVGTEKEQWESRSVTVHDDRPSSATAFDRGHGNCRCRAMCLRGVGRGGAPRFRADPWTMIGFKEGHVARAACRLVLRATTLGRVTGSSRSLHDAWTHVGVGRTAHRQKRAGLVSPRVSHPARGCQPILPCPRECPRRAPQAHPPSGGPTGFERRINRFRSKPDSRSRNV